MDGSPIGSVPATFYGSGKTYSYNQAGQLSQVWQGSTLLASYDYDYQGLRARKATTSAAPQGALTVLYHYDQFGKLAAETREDGTPLRSYVWRDDAPLAQIEYSPSRRILYYEVDHLNTPRAASDESAKVIWRWESDAFGSTPPNEDPDGDGIKTTINLRFPGQYFDRETGLHYNYFRDYDPRNGRYVQSDPIGLAGGMNTYAYAANNPLLFIDPLGLAYFAKRPLAGAPWMGPASSNPIDDFFNTEISHEQLFFEDGKSPSNIGFFDDGTLKTEPNPTGYRNMSSKFNDCIMRKAVANTGPLSSYCLIGQNCQTWAGRVRAEYARLTKNPQIQKECEACNK